jgi:TonB family protein
MSHMSTQSGSSLDASERRQFARQQVKSLAYLDIGADNGGIVLNVSEGGLAVHAVAALPAEPVIGLRLQLPRSTKRLEAQAKVAWRSGSKKDAGVEFIDLSEEARHEIREWLAAENLPEPVYVERPPQFEAPPVRRPARTDKWTSLVAELTSEGATPAATTTTSPTTNASPLRHGGDNGGAEIHDAPASPAGSAAAIPRALEAEIADAVAWAGSGAGAGAEALAREVREPAPIEIQPPISSPAAFETSAPEPDVFSPSISAASGGGATEPETKGIAANAETAHEQPARELTIEEALSGNLAESRGGILPEGEAGFISSAAHPAVEPETVASVEPPERTLNAELSLPSDTLLNATAAPFHAPATQPFTVVPGGGGGGEKSAGVNRSRFARESSRNAPTSDDFLKKARSLFGPKRGAGQFPESEEPTEGPVAVPEAAKEIAAVEEAAPAHATSIMAPAQTNSTMGSAQPFASAAPNELPAVEIPAPADSIPTAVSELRRAEVRASAARPRPAQAARGFELRSTMGVLALCVIVAFVCVGLGIAVGRLGFAPAVRVAVSGTGPASGGTSSSGTSSSGTSAAASDSRNAPSENPSAATSSRGNTRASKQNAQGGRGRASRSAAADSGRGNTDDVNPASVAPAEEDRSAAASQPESGNQTAAAAQVSPASSYKVSATPSMPPPAAVPAASSAAGTAPIVHDTGARPQPPPERVVGAHLMYRVEPFYPKDATREHVEGIVKIHATVGVDGTVKNLRVVGGPGLLASAALDAAQYWRYIPALRNGQPVESEEEINIEFHLPR